MFQIFLGPSRGRTNEIVNSGTLISAEDTARKKVLEAKGQKTSMLASVFSQESGSIVSGFATANLASEVSIFPQIKVL